MALGWRLLKSVHFRVFGRAEAGPAHVSELAHLPRPELRKGADVSLPSEAPCWEAEEWLWKEGSEDSAARVQFRSGRAHASAETGALNL